MAERPVFTPSTKGPSPVWRHDIDFQWFPGMALSQSQKSITSLHKVACSQLDVDEVLEISSKSKQPEGVKLSAFNLMIVTTKHHRKFSVECAYQSSKVFERGGPYIDLLEKKSIEAKKDPRLNESGRLIKYQFYGQEWSLEPKTAFYDWLYINALGRRQLSWRHGDNYPGGWEAGKFVGGQCVFSGSLTFFLEGCLASEARQAEGSKPGSGGQVADPEGAVHRPRPVGRRLVHGGRECFKRPPR